jgi:hypothetical protein
LTRESIVPLKARAGEGFFEVDIMVGNLKYSVRES